MNRPVDVLVVIAKHRDSHMSMAMADAYSAQEYPKLRDAHTAVAELIESINTYRAELNKIGGADEYKAAAERLDAALARVGGAK